MKNLQIINIFMISDEMLVETNLGTMKIFGYELDEVKDLITTILSRNICNNPWDLLNEEESV